MGWPDLKVAVEYDGQQHWSDLRQHARDIERLESLAALRWAIIRASWTQLRDRPQEVVDRVAEALGVTPNVQLLNGPLEACVQQLHARRGRRAQ